SLANSIWIFLWHYEIFSLTLLAMITILTTLLVINRYLAQSESSTKWLVKLPFSIYLGWISVATIANVSQFLYYFNWSGWGIDATVWAALMLAVATLLGILMAWRENDLPYALVLIWAFIGITVSQAGAAVVITAAWTGVAVLALAGLASVIKSKKVY
ncbi:MAG: hypothetical protein MUP11_08110, partial [Anaerolineales bacterium]|nr:hypothetical protein [Anaerolineales bacterium]